MAKHELGSTEDLLNALNDLRSYVDEDMDEDEREEEAEGLYVLLYGHVDQSTLDNADNGNLNS